MVLFREDEIDFGNFLHSSGVKRFKLVDFEKFSVLF